MGQDDGTPPGPWVGTIIRNLRILVEHVLGTLHITGRLVNLKKEFKKKENKKKLNVYSHTLLLFF